MKRIAEIAVMTAALSAMAGCGGDDATAKPTTQSATTAATASMAAKIVHGSDGWLFWGPRQIVYAQPSEGPRKNIETVIDFNRQLKGAGISLVVVTLPDQAYAGREHWPDAKMPFVREHFDSAFAYARSQGVTLLDMTATVEKLRAEGVKVALSQDAHLSPAAYEAIAAEIAEAVKAVHPMEGRARDFTTTKVQLLEPATAAEAAQITPEQFVINASVVRHATVSPLVAERAGSEVLIMGDSNVIELSPVNASLAEYLARDLGVVPDVCSRFGGNSSDVLRGDLARRHDNLEGTKLVIWIFLEGSLVYDDAWKKIPVIVADR